MVHGRSTWSFRLSATQLRCLTRTHSFDVPMEAPAVVSLFFIHLHLLVHLEIRCW